jgi:hypothetical protein
MPRSVISLLLVGGFLLTGCGPVLQPPSPPAIAADRPSADGINGYRWGTPMTQIAQPLELLDGYAVEDGLVAPQEYLAREISSYFHPGEASPYAGIDLYDLQYIACDVARIGDVVLCGGAFEYGGKERLQAATATEPPEQANLRRFLSILVSQLGQPEVQRVTADGRTIKLLTSTSMPYSDTDVMRYTWCRSPPFFKFQQCGDPFLVVSFDPLTDYGYALFVSEILRNTVVTVQGHSNVDYLLFKQIFGPQWNGKASLLPTTGTNIISEHIALRRRCSSQLASERVLTRFALSHPAAVGRRPLSHPVPEWQYENVLDFFPSPPTPELVAYFRGYKYGFQYAYFEGRWRGEAYYQQWRLASNAGNETNRWQGRGFLDGAALRPPQPGADFDAAQFERFRNARDSGCELH